MAMPWFRMWTEWVYDPKIQLLSFEDQRHFVAILCLKGNGTINAGFSDDQHKESAIAHALGISKEDCSAVKVRLCGAALIDAHWEPRSWGKRQISSDHSKERTRQYRARGLNCKDVTVNGSHRDGEEQIRTEQIRKEAPKSAFKSVGTESENLRLSARAALTRKLYENT